MNSTTPTLCSKDEVARRLKSAGINPTQQRIEIGQILFSRMQHLSAEQIMTIVNAQGEVASKATVYNTLGLFASKGLLREVIVDPNKVFYDSNISDHHHFYNVDTGSLMDIDPAEVVVHKLPTLPAGTHTDGVDVIIRIRQSN